MPQTISIGTACFVRLNGRTFPGIVVGFWSDSIKGAAVRVETEAAQHVRRPWTAMSFWMRDCKGVAASGCTVHVPADDAERAALEHEVENPPIDDRIKWLAAQAGELPLASLPRRLVPQFPEGIKRPGPLAETGRVGAGD